METGYTDIHTHIIPAVDDGAETLEESLDMLRLAYNQGIRRIITTPHFVPGAEEADNSANCLKAFEELKMAVAEEPELREIELLMGNEIYYTSETVQALKAGRALTMCETKYVLVEFSVRAVYKSLYNGLKEMVEAGYRPIIAHTERYSCLFRNETRIAELIKLGAYIQINTDSFAGGIFDREGAWCLKLLKKGMVHFIASDCHDSNRRRPLMEDTVKLLIKKGAEDRVGRILKDNIKRLLANEYI